MHRLSILYGFCVLWMLTLSLAAFPAHAGLFGKDDDKAAVEAVPPANAPRSFADLSEVLLPAVVNISSTTKVTQPTQVMPDIPEFPEGSPFNEFFKDFISPLSQRIDTC